MAFRKVICHGRNWVGRFPSIKMKRMITFESRLELDYVYLLESDPEVTWFTEQDPTIEYEVDGKAHHYTPDFHILRSGREWIVEVKPDEFVDKDENQRKFKAAEAWCADMDSRFRIATSSEIRAQPRLKNAYLLVNAARHHVTYDVQTSIVTQLVNADAPLSVLDLAELICPERLPWMLTAICHMAYYRKVYIADDNTPITLSSLITH